MSYDGYFVVHLHQEMIVVCLIAGMVTYERKVRAPQSTVLPNRKAWPSRQKVQQKTYRLHLFFSNP